MKRISGQHRQLLEAVLEVRSRIRDLIYTSSSIPTELLGDLADRLTAGMKARALRRRPQLRRESPEEKRERRRRSVD